MIFTRTILGDWGLPERLTRPSMPLATTMFWTLRAVGFTFLILLLLTCLGLIWTLPTLERGALIALGGSSLGASSPSRAGLRVVLTAALALWSTPPRIRSSTTFSTMLPASSF